MVKYTSFPWSIPKTRPSLLQSQFRRFTLIVPTLSLPGVTLPSSSRLLGEARFRSIRDSCDWFSFLTL